ncbi:hypothetical protein GY45DRAFT_646958 [Cubamyces sp. BRFM 1775]|nr:hypothetical protein GY45DRAFT_646958 [Cubamyces sp. BRFM 1775]
MDGVHLCLFLAVLEDASINSPAAHPVTGSVFGMLCPYLGMSGLNAELRGRPQPTVPLLVFLRLRLWFTLQNMERPTDTEGVSRHPPSCQAPVRIKALLRAIRKKYSEVLTILCMNQARLSPVPTARFRWPTARASRVPYRL